MLALATQRRVTLALLIGVPAFALAGLAWFAWHGSQSRFLPPDAAADWIHYPVPPQVSSLAVRYEQHSIFRRTFELTELPASAWLRVRAFQDCSVTLNGQPVDLPPVDHWNQVRAAALSEQLRVGTNELRVVVVNDVGPPVLWLALEGPGCLLRSDERWNVSLDGATECFAVRAGQGPPLPSRQRRGGRPSARRILAGLLADAAALPGSLGRYSPRAACRGEPALLASSFGPKLLDGLAWPGCNRRALGGALRGEAALRTPAVPFGFDALHHLQYIDVIQTRGALPLADEGWEMHHPPLFYLLAAGLLTACQLSALEPGAGMVLRVLGLAAGLAQLFLIAGCLRLLFPGQARRQLTGLVLAAFLPAQLYVCQFVSNEWLLTTLGTAALYLCLRCLRDGEPSPVRHALLGLCLGGALLTKVTALIVVGAVLITLTGQLAARRERRAAFWLRGVGLTFVVAVVVSGWHYVRVWARFGTPLVGNYDLASGFWFWQPPGYGTSEYLGRLGGALANPFFSALGSLPDGLYSTFWGDGLCSGVGAWCYRPPWNYELMAAGFLLALVPSLLIGAGLCVALVNMVRRPCAEWFLLLGVAAGLGLRAALPVSPLSLLRTWPGKLSADRNGYRRGTWLARA